MTPKLNSLFRVIIIISAFLFSSANHAAEVITSYHSDIIVEENGDLLVTEKITVIAEGDQIKRGIFRDFPIVVKNRGGKTVLVKFDILSIKRDGEADDWHREAYYNFARIYIGNADVFIAHGTHTYEITYRTDRQLRFFKTYDELFWNVTGTEWAFPIEKASARVVLPAKVKVTETNFFTGSFGSTETNATSQINPLRHSVDFVTTRPLGIRAGLTIGIKMEKGVFNPVPPGKDWEWFWRDYIGEVAGLIALLVVSLYYFIRWWQIGRDPPSGVIVPNWDTSNELSPALANYIDEKGFGTHAWKAMTAAILNLAVKGHVVIDQLNDKPTITRTDKPIGEDLPIGEAKIVNILDSRVSRSIRAIKSQGTSIQSMHSKFKSAISDEHRDAYYHHNWGAIVTGILLSLAGVVAILITGGVSMDLVAIIIPVTIGTIVISLFSFKLVNLLGSHVGMIEKTVAVFFAAMIVVIVLTSGIFSFSFLYQSFTQPLLLSCFVGILVANVLFFFLLGAPTSLGRERMDAMEGLKTYLVLAEQDRMNLAGAPTMSPQHYETLLPYAVAMGVEKPWSNAFQSWLISAAAVAAGYAASSYAPGWYRGDFGSDGAIGSLESVSDSMASSFTSSLPAPKSSSSGFSGGGSSGGGGGGGGGGGW